MRVLLIGGGGREHALAQAISRSPLLDELIAAPGNPGIARVARCVGVKADNVARLDTLAGNQRVDLVVAGPEAPLAAGLADRLARRGVPCFGPRRQAAQIEASKAFARDFCARRGIPSARYAVVETPKQVLEALDEDALGLDIVIKASGLAAGKGVFLPKSRAEAERTAFGLLDGELGDAGRQVVIEEKLEGPELSVFSLTDGTSVVRCGTARDYKRRFDGGQGPNTGGMGSVSPGGESGELLDLVYRDIVEPTIAGLREERRTYRGVLYTGLMLTADGPRVLEFNVRFGDPEAQAILPRLEDDLLPFLAGAASGKLPEGPLRFRGRSATTVVLAAHGYPNRGGRGKRIQGVPDGVETEDGALVFHAGTAEGKDGHLTTNGGRVLAVTGMGARREDARRAAYRAADAISWDGMAMRRDIGEDVPDLNLNATKESRR